MGLGPESDPNGSKSDRFEIIAESLRLVMPPTITDHLGVMVSATTKVLASNLPSVNSGIRFDGDGRAEGARFSSKDGQTDGRTVGRSVGRVPAAPAAECGSLRLPQRARFAHPTEGAIAPFRGAFRAPLFSLKKGRRLATPLGL